jgi:hypothetical protein
MQVDFNFYGNQVSGYLPEDYDWCLPLLDASLELENGVPKCPKFHCAGLIGKDFLIEIATPRQTFKMVVSDTGTSFEPRP